MFTARDKSTGKIVLSNSGNLPKEAFIQTAKNIQPVSEEIIIDDGKVQSAFGKVSKPYYNQRQICWTGSFSDLGGYANMNREICLRLIHHGIYPRLEILKTAVQTDQTTTAVLRALASSKKDPDAPLVVGFTPMQINQKYSRVAFYTMMETQGIHAHFASTCNEYADEIWTPCKFYLDQFVKAGINKPSFLFPLGVNHRIYTPDAKYNPPIFENLQTNKKTRELPNVFKFMSLFGWSYRKGADVLCRSFFKAFGATDDVALVIYSRYMCSSAEVHKQFIRNEIAKYLKESGNEHPAHIFLCSEEIPICDLPGCYANSNCFVFCSRGEGFGLPVIEAGACGLPVISTFNTAMTQYLDDDVAYLIPTDRLSTANEKLTWITEYYRDQLFPELGEESVALCSEMMKKVYKDNKEGLQKASNFRKRILAEYTWDECASRVASRIKDWK